MFFKKKPVIVALTILFIIIAALGATYVISHINKGAKQNGNVVTSRYFQVTLPEGATLTSDEDNDNVYAMSTEPYGELRVSIHRSSMNVTQLVQRGEITKTDATVGGVNVTKQTIDYSKIVRGTTSNLQMRYEIVINEIPKPSADEYTNVSVLAMSKRPLTSGEKKDISQKADDIIRSLEIK